MVGSKSIGAFVGGVYASEADPEKLKDKCKEWSSVSWFYLLDWQGAQKLNIVHYFAPKFHNVE